MPGFRCGTCGKEHDDLPMDLGYRRPTDYFKIPEDERSVRIELSDDLCVIDDTEFYIRGVLPLPVRDSDQTFQWGTWAAVSEADFHRYIELWDADISPDEPLMHGCLSGGVRDYPESDQLGVLIRLRSDGARPLFTVCSVEHPLGRAQRDGITWTDVHSFVAPHLLTT